MRRSCSGISRASRSTAETLSAYLATQLSAIEMPKIIEFRAELPKSAVGKILKTQLVAEHLATQQAAGDHRSHAP